MTCKRDFASIFVAKTRLIYRQVVDPRRPIGDDQCVYYAMRPIGRVDLRADL